MPSRHPPGRILRLLGQLRDRPLARVLGVYALSAWLTLLVLQVFLATTALPAWIPDLFLALVLLGLPPILAIGVLEDRSRPAGEEPVEEGRAEESPASFGERMTPEAAPARGSVRSRSFAWAGLVLLMGAALWWGLGHPGLARGGARPMAVALLMPAFPERDEEESGDGSGDAAWALLEDLHLRFAQHEALRSFEVPAEPRPATPRHTSTQSWAEILRPQVQRAVENGAHGVLAVRWATEEAGEGARVEALYFDSRGRVRWERVSPQPDSDGNPLMDAFQAEVARAVWEELGVKGESGAPARLSHDLGAFQAFSRGVYWRRLGGRYLQVAESRGEGLLAALDQAEAAFLEAAEADPAFGAAWSGLSEVLSLRFSILRTDGAFLGTLSPELERAVAVRRSRGAVDRALQIDPEDPVARKVLGDLHLRAAALGDRERESLDFLPSARRGLHEYTLSAERLPGWSEVHRALGETARTLGHWALADSAWNRLLELDPTNPFTHMEAGITDHLRRQHARAIPRLERALSLDPSLDRARRALFEARLARWGDLDSARVAFQTPAGRPEDTDPPSLRYRVHLYARDYGAAQQVASEAGWSWDPDLCSGFTPGQMTGTIRGFLGQLEGSVREWNGARSELLTALETGSIDAASGKGALAEALAWLGDSPQAIRTAHDALLEVPWETDAVRGAACVKGLAKARLLTGNAREAVDLLVWLLSQPGPLNRGELWFDPIWEQVRTDPRLSPWLRPPPWTDDPF